MKNILRSRIFTFVVGAIIFSGITGVAAYNMLAKNINYTPHDTTWKKSNGDNITNVEEALDELYTATNNQKGATQVATLTTQGATYTMQNDGYITGTIVTLQEGGAEVYLEQDNISKKVVSTDYRNSSNHDVSIYASKGVVVKTRIDGGTYNLTVYEWK